MSDYGILDEKELLDLLQQGDHAAFSELYQRFSLFLLTYAHKITQDQSEAQDIVQTIFINLWTNRKRLSVRGPLFNYLLQSVRYGFYKSLRSRQTFSRYEADLQKFLLEERSTTDEYILERELMQRLEKLAENFPEKMGKVFIMTYFQHLSPVEIAQKLSISKRTVQNLLSQASKRARLGIGLVIALAVLPPHTPETQCIRKSLENISIFS
ncbi:MAG TPA: sigma-70 family RNA polymerase sigma factor [Agriterribacter sp.]|nr:sigma-70 family RNA polymerase sigma factor [Agriterribacter sp.]